MSRIERIIYCSFVLPLGLFLFAQGCSNNSSQNSIDSDSSIPGTGSDSGIDTDVEIPCEFCIGEGHDYFTKTWNRPFDYSWSYDFTWENQIDDLRIEDGWLTATIAETQDPSFFFLFAGVHGNVNWGQGQDRPIDARQYSRLSYRICLQSDSTNPTSIIYWYLDGPSGNSDFKGMQSGCHIYTRELSQFESWAGGDNGEQHGLRFDLNNLNVGDTFEVDWVRLTSRNDQNVTVPWTDLPTPATYLTLYLDVDENDFDGDLVATIDSPEPNGAFLWGVDGEGVETEIYPSELPPGSYYLYWVNSETGYEEYLSQPFVINQAPTIQFQNPSLVSGIPYGESHGNIWDMDADGTDGTVVNCSASNFENNEVSATCTHNDPQFQFNLPEPIDSSYYRYLTIDVWSQYSFGSTPEAPGGMMRVLWGSDIPGGTSEDILIGKPNKWATYSFDLLAMNAEGIVPTNWLDNDWTWLRFDPNENVTGIEWEWRLRNAVLTGPPVAQGAIDLLWNVGNESNEPVKITLSYTEDPQSNTPIEFASFLSSEATGNRPWQTDDIEPGDYYIQGCLFDGLSKRCIYSDAPARIVASP